MSGNDPVFLVIMLVNTNLGLYFSVPPLDMARYKQIRLSRCALCLTFRRTTNLSQPDWRTGMTARSPGVCARI